MSRFFEFFLNHWDLFLALGVILALLIGGTLSRRIKGIREVGPPEAVKLINQEHAVVVDVREQNEFREGHIVDAIHIPLGSLQQRMGELEKHKDAPIIIGCRSGNRSSIAAGQLRKAGYENIHNLRGGVMAWQSAGLPLTRERKKR